MTSIINEYSSTSLKMVEIILLFLLIFMIQQIPLKSVTFLNLSSSMLCTEKDCLSLTSARNWTQFSQSVTSHSWEGGENQKTNSQNSWDKDSLIGKAKAMHTRKAEKGIHSLLPISRELFSHLRKAGTHHKTVISYDKPLWRFSQFLIAEDDAI